MKKSLEKLLTSLSNFRRARLISRFKKREKILDLGCGSGSFIRQVNKKHWHRYAVDPHVSFKNEESGVKFYSQDLFACHFADKFFDVITMWHVIEHLTDHKTVLREINRVLDDDGLIIISTPNLGSFGYKIAGPDWFHFNASKHRHLFNFTSLKKLLESSGFSIIRVNYPLEYPLDLFHSLTRAKIKNKNLRIFLAPFFLPALLMIKFFLSLIKRGETMEVVCAKKRKIN